MKFFELEVWKKSVDLAVAVHRATDAFPKRELYGMTAQMRRSALSIPRNIAEGEGRFTRKDTHRFLGDARGSAYELQSDILVAQRLELLDAASAQRLFENAKEVARMLTALMRYERSRFD